MVENINQKYEVDFKEDLSAYDFEFQKVIVQHEDGTRCEFAYAFLEEGLAKVKQNGHTFPVIKVYTEHNGDHWFPSDDLAYYRIEPHVFPRSFWRRLKKLLEYWNYLYGRY
jgi:hypothetical protein